MTQLSMFNFPFMRRFLRYLSRLGTSPRRQERETQHIRGLRLSKWALLLCCATSAIFAQTLPPQARPTSITVVMDDNYPPFIFRDASGQVQGILKDSWALWEARTGIAVNLRAMDWAMAQQVIQTGQADVIDTIFVTEARKRIYEFSAPYAKLDVPIFFHQSIGGIVNADSLKGFTVGVKDGDACIDVLRGHGVESMKEFTSYSAVVAAAGAGDVRVFCVDQPPAVYLLNQLGIEKQFRHSLPLYTGEFHRAVRKGDSALLKIVEDGFARISAAEREAIERKWYGAEIDGPGVHPYARYLGYVLIGVLLVTMILIFWNLTLRRRVAAKTAELAGQRDTAQRYLDIAGVMLMALDRDGRITMINRKGAQLLGKPESALLGMDWFESFLPQDGRNEVRRYFKRLMLGEEQLVERFENRIVTAGGVELIMAWHNAPLRNEAGIVVGVLSSAEDITERKQAEAARTSLGTQLRESQKMQAIGTLAGGIAHDFNNILATILGNVDLARQDVKANPLALQSLEEIRKASARGRNLVQQILSFSRREPTERKPTVLAPIVEESVRLLRATMPARLILDVQCEPDMPPVLADATQIQQVLINLATNAMQAMQSGPGHIRIRMDTVLLDAAFSEAHPATSALHAKQPGHAVRLTVSDDGPGMDAVTLARIFEPFFTTKPVNEGTGLGLSVVHGIVQTHEGAIEVGSQPDHGATFTIYLPAAKTQAVATAPDTDEQHAASVPKREFGGGQHILYLDDDESLVFLVRRLLERRGFRISGYTDQRDALDALRADPAAFDLVVTDYNMPGMSGLDVARAVRTIRADLPVAIASGFVDETLQSQAEGANVCELIFKANAVEYLCEAFARLAQAVGKESKRG